MSNVLIGITGCIAAYKSLNLIRDFVRNGDNVKVILTKNAEKFVTALTVRTLSNNKAYTDLFDSENEYTTEHIALSDWADILVVAPASANIIGKFAHGIADDLLSTQFLSFSKPVLIIPSMNEKMLCNPAVKENIELLKKRGIKIMNPDSGFLACGAYGAGRFPDSLKIFQKSMQMLSKGEKLKGMKVVVTGGATIEKIDPVRIITNLSSGRMGNAFVNAVLMHKADSVTYIHGKIAIEEPYFSKNIYAETVSDMKMEIEKAVSGADILIMCAALTDFKPEYVDKKIKRIDGMELKFSGNIDILKSLKNSNILKIGFALETDDIEKNGLKKLKDKNLDYIIINTPDNIDNTGGAVIVCGKNGKKKKFENKSKDSLAYEILEWIKL